MATRAPAKVASLPPRSSFLVTPAPYPAWPAGKKNNKNENEGRYTVPWVTTSNRGLPTVVKYAGRLTESPGSKNKNRLEEKNVAVEQLSFRKVEGVMAGGGLDRTR